MRMGEGVCGYFQNKIRVVPKFCCKKMKYRPYNCARVSLLFCSQSGRCTEDPFSGKTHLFQQCVRFDKPLARL